MFDWEDEEITSIIWGEEDEKEDHIVQYPAENYEEQSKGSNQEAGNVKITQKTTVSKNIIDLGQGNNTQHYTHGRVSADGFGSLLDLSSSKATKLAHENTDEKAQVDNGSQIFDNHVEDKDGSNFVDYGWANVGSFDDLDRIISNHDLELWSSTKDVIGCPEKPELSFVNPPSLNLGDLKSNYQHFETKSVVIKDEKHANDGCGGKNENVHMEKMKKEQGPHRQHGKISSLQIVRNQETESFGYRQFLNAFPSPHGYNMIVNQDSAGSALTHQQVSSASSYLSDKTRDTPLSMTPQEKIEKLRRRQQMRALLAIRKQQEEIKQQDDHSNLALCSQESHMQFVKVGAVEIDQSLSNLIPLDVSSPLEQSDSDARSTMMDKTALADTVVHQLQNVIAGLGIQMRFCIRDSLFRLAQGAIQRKNDGTTNKRNNDGDGVIIEGANNPKSTARIPDGETKTNPIDRVVARLLFHTPPGELAQSPSATPTMKFVNEHNKDDRFSCLVENQTTDGSGLETRASSLL